MALMYQFLKRVMLRLAFLVVLLRPGFAAPQDPCPIDYEYRPEDHRCIKYYPFPKLFWDAEATCVKDGGHLISIHNAFDNNMVSSILMEYNGGVSWIGAYRNSSNGAFFWTDSSPVNYNKWAVNNPHPGDHAVVYAGASWTSTTPTMSHYFLCEKIPAFVPCTNTTRIIPACADGWTVNSEFKSCYKVGRSKTWSNAKIACEAMDAELVSLSSTSEQLFVNGLASSGIMGDNSYQTWVGAFENKGVWQWLNGNPVTTLVHMLSSTAKQGCAALMTDSNLYKAELAAIDCSSTLRAYVCKTDIQKL